MGDSMNLRSVTLKEFINVIKDDLKYEDYSPVMGIGKSAIGKSESIKELSQTLGIGYKEFRLLLMDEKDLLGIPDIVKDENGNKVTTYASSEMLPNAAKDGETGLLVMH